MQNTQQKQQGFSLVELSIVLIIVGLLVGGVMAGASLVHSAKIKNIISEVDTYTKAIHNFREQYRYYPGDFPAATQVWGEAAAGVGCRSFVSTDKLTCNGDGNGRIDKVAATSHEHLRAWQQLSNAGFLEGQFSGTYHSGGLAAGINTPEAPFKPGVYEMHFFDSYPVFGRVGHYIKAAVPTPASTGANGGLLSPADARSIDQKVDDGRADSGSVVALDGLDKSGCVSNGTTPSAPSNYLLNSEQTACRIYYWLD